MFLFLRKKRRTIVRNKSKRYRAKLKAKETKRQRRLAGLK